VVGGQHLPPGRRTRGQEQKEEDELGKKKEVVG
jgi:hypothetical protein